MANTRSTPPPPFSHPFRAALPFWLSLSLVPLVWLGAYLGGVLVFLVPLVVWYLFSIIDAFAGLNATNYDTHTHQDQLYWYKLITWIWPAVQFVTLFGILDVATRGSLATWEMVILFIGLGVLTGTVGINYSHELMHQSSRFERWLADALLAMVLYSHFRSEHLLVHHTHVGTPKDAVTARYNEGFYHYFARVLTGCYVSAFRAERALLARKGRSWWWKTNPFWQYWLSQILMLGLAYVIAGPIGVMLFCVQAFVAILHLELVNYIEHYGLTRRHLGEGRYEPVGKHHSWNEAHRLSSWLLINLQRHSDHHIKPKRPFPLLQTYAEEEAPVLPHSYTVMTLLATVPPLWRRVMNRRVREWRKLHYPDIEDWHPYNKARNPLPLST